MRMAAIGSCLEACFSVGGSVYEGLGGMALLEMYHRGWALRFQKRTSFPGSSHCLMCVGKIEALIYSSTVTHACLSPSSL